MFNSKLLSYFLLIGLLLTILSINISTSKATDPPKQWTKTYGEILEEYAYSMVQTSDGGFAIAGTSNSFSTNNNFDFYLVKTDASGNQEWSKTYGGVNYERANCVIQTDDDGYALAGMVTNGPSDLNLDDFYLVKTDVYGNMEWNKTYGGPKYDRAYSMIQTNDGGYAIVGYTISSDYYGFDGWLIKTDAYGNMEWNKTYGGRSADYVYSVLQTSDNGYVLAGTTYIYRGDGSSDFWLIKTDVYGNEEWNRTYGFIDNQYAYSMIQTNDGGFALAGWTGAVRDFLLVKTDLLGNMEWSKTYGGSNIDLAYSVIQTNDDGYMLAGSTGSFGGYFDFLLIKTDEYGNQQWSKTYGGTHNDYAYSVLQTDDNGYAIAGYTECFGAGTQDVLLIKTDDFGNQLTLTTLQSVGGQIYPSPDNYTSPDYLKDTAWIIAHPDAGYTFSHFLIDGKVTPAQYIEEDGDYTYYLSMDTSHTVQAIFTVDVPFFPTLTILNSPGGQIYPQLGYYIPPNLEDAMWLIAHPTPGYRFNYFLIDGKITANQYFEEDGDYTYYLIMDTSHSVQAIFVPS